MAPIPPHNLAAEESLLGAMLLSRDAVPSVHSQGEPADPVTVAAGAAPAGSTAERDGSGVTVVFDDRIGNSDEPKYRNAKGSVPRPFNVDAVEVARRTGRLYITEGPADAVALLHHDIAVVGVPGAHVLKPEWVKEWAGLDVYVIADNDAPGENFRHSVDRLASPLATVHHVTVPEQFKDLDDWRL